jgi:hypothetical protein
MKSVSINKVIDAVRALDPPGRFLEFAADGTLTEAPHMRAYLKTSQALRDSRRVWTEENRMEPRSLDPGAVVSNSEGFLEWNAAQTAPNQRSPSLPKVESNAAGPPALLPAATNPASSPSATDPPTPPEADQPSIPEEMTAQHSETALSPDRPPPQKARDEALLDTKPPARANSRTKSTPPLESDDPSPGSSKSTSDAARGPSKPGKHKMLTDTRVRLPSKARLAKAGLSQIHEPGPRRTKAQEGPGIKEPHNHDVLFGRGPKYCTNLGNVRFRIIVWENKELYASMRK